MNALTIKVGTRELGYEVIDHRELKEYAKLNRYSQKIDKLVEDTKKFFKFLFTNKIVHSVIFSVFMYFFMETMGFGLFTPIYVGCEELIKNMGVELAIHPFKQL